MPTIYLAKEQYDQIVQRGAEVSAFVRDAVAEALEHRPKKMAKREEP